MQRFAMNNCTHTRLGSLEIADLQKLCAAVQEVLVRFCLVNNADIMLPGTCIRELLLALQQQVVNAMMKLPSHTDGLGERIGVVPSQVTTGTAVSMRRG